MDVTDFFANKGKYPRWGNLAIVDKMHLGNKEEYERIVDLMEDWDDALEEDMDRNTDMCISSDNVNVGFGPDEVMTCRKKTTHNVTYESYDPESDTWYNVSVHVCTFHADQVKADIAEYGDKFDQTDMSRNWAVSELQDK